MLKKIPIVIIILLLVIAVLVTKLHINTPNSSIKTSAQTLGLKIVANIPLSGGANRLDYQDINYDNNRLYVSHLGSNMVHVFDLTNQKIIKDIPLASSPYGILVVPQLHTVYVGIGGNGQVAVIDENSLQVTKYVQAGTTPDGLGYDPIHNKVFVTNENSGNITVIDAKTNERIKDIPVGGGVGNTHYDSVSKLIYTVSGDDNTLVEIDPSNNKVVNNYPTTGCGHPHGFLIEETTHYALITCKSNDAFIVFDLTAKKIISKDTTGSGADVLAFDSGLRRLYVAAESGVVTIFSVGKNNVKKLSEGRLANGAHTVSVDKNTHYVYIPLENVDGKPILRIYKP